jgi:pilus assembly protein CpaB
MPRLSRRLMAAIAAVLLAAFGAAVLISYVGNADARARAGEKLVPVLVVNHQVTAGSAANSLADSVSIAQVPKRLAATGSISTLAELKGRVANADLLPGEQVVAGRFSDPATFRPAGAVAVPAGLVEVSISLEAQRTVGGAVKAGDKVGVQLTNQPSGDNTVSSLTVFRVFHDVLVTRVTSSSDTAAKAEMGAASTVTLAVPPADASVVVLGASAKSVWLSLEKAAPGAAASTSTTTTGTTATFSTGGSK